MSFNSELEELKKTQDKWFSDVNDIETQKKAELERVMQAIEEKYSLLKKGICDELELQKEGILNYCKEIEAYSYFDEGQIGKVIAHLMKIFEGVNYSYQDAFYFSSYVGEKKKKGSTTIRKHPRIVIQDEEKQSTYVDDNKGNGLDSLVERGKAIVLVENADTLDNGIPFYRANPNTHSLDQCVNYGRFSYVKDFIDSLIDYKREKGIYSISSDEIEAMELDFILERVDQIQENYKAVDQRQEEEMRQRLAANREERQKRLEKVLETRTTK